MTSKGLTDVSSMSHSTEMARMDHGNDTGMYLGAEAAKQRILQVEHRRPCGHVEGAHGRAQH